MKLNAVLSASKEFIRTHEGFSVCPSIVGLARHIEATMRLHDAFAPDASGTLVDIVFAMYRWSLNLLCDVRTAVGRLVRWF